MKDAMKKSPMNIRHWVVKRCARDCGANAVLFRRKERKDDKCPFCGNIESVIHIYKCPDKRVQDIWEKAIHELEQYLQQLGTDPSIRGQLIRGLQGWRMDTISTTDPMAIDQSQIGWDGIMEGVLGRHWEDEQEHYSKNESEATNGRKWTQLLIRRIWKIAWEMRQNRNHEVHNNDLQQQMEELHQKVRAEIEIGHQGYTDMEKLFSKEAIGKVFTGNANYIQCWIQSVKVRRERHQSIQRDSTTFTQMRQTLRNFLNQKKG
jgi:hypothetical protein